MAKVSSPAASTAVVAALSLLGIAACIPIDSARADNCAAAPNASAPQGQHWYYRVDRASHRKCWYLHATVRLPHHTTAQPVEASAESASAGPVTQPPAAPAGPAAAAPAPPPPSSEAVPQPTANAPSSESNTDNTHPAPHVTVLTVRTVSTPFVGTAPAPQQPEPGNVNAPPRPQTLPGDENTAGSNIKPAESAAATPLPPVPDTARHELAKTLDAANATPRTGPGEMFLLLALALGIIAVVIVIASRLAGRYSTPRLSDDPDAAWVRYRAAHQRYDETASYEEQDVPFVDPEGQHGLADPHEPEWDGPPSADQAGYPAAQSQDGEPAPAETAAPSLKDIQLALRVLRQARQSRVA